MGGLIGVSMVGRVTQNDGRTLIVEFLMNGEEYFFILGDQNRTNRMLSVPEILDKYPVGSEIEFELEEAYGSRETRL
jgi:hypothetical protein